MEGNDLFAPAQITLVLQHFESNSRGAVWLSIHITFAGLIEFLWELRLPLHQITSFSDIVATQRRLHRTQELQWPWAS